MHADNDLRVLYIGHKLISKYYIPSSLVNTISLLIYLLSLNVAVATPSFTLYAIFRPRPHVSVFKSTPFSKVAVFARPHDNAAFSKASVFERLHFRTRFRKSPLSNPFSKVSEGENDRKVSVCQLASGN